MNYYERHLGDYARDAGHLSMLEHGAFSLLLDRYYSTEAPIPEDQAHRVCRARSQEEREAVDAVLREFFTLTDGAWVNKRAEREIERKRARVEAAKTNGVRGGRPSKNPTGTQEKPSGFPLGSVSETQSKALQSPVTSHQTEIPSVPDGTGAEAPQPSPSDVIFSLGVPLLVAAGLTDKHARSMLGMQRKQSGDRAVIDALQRCASVQPSEPVAWLQAALRPKPQAPPGPTLSPRGQRNAKWLEGTSLDPKLRQQSAQVIELDSLEVSHAPRALRP